jgi:hypothetical protein
LPSYTWSIWLNADSAPSTGGGNGQPIWNGDVGFNFSWHHNGASFTQAATHRDAADWRTSQISTTLSAGTWYHIAGTYDGTDITIFLNGQFEDVQLAAAPMSPNGSFTIGGPTSGGVTFLGKVDEVRVANVPRTGVWLNAEYASMIDSLITYGAPESL